METRAARVGVGAEAGAVADAAGVTAAAGNGTAAGTAGTAAAATAGVPAAAATVTGFYLDADAADGHEASRPPPEAKHMILTIGN